MLARTLGLFTLALAATLYVSSLAPVQASNTDQDQDQPQKKNFDKSKDQKKGFPGKGGFGKGGFKGGFGKGFPGKGGFGKGFPGKGEPKKDEAKKDEPKSAETKKSEEKLDAATIKARYETYKKLYEDSQREAAAKSIESRIDHLITELQALRAEVRSKK